MLGAGSPKVRFEASKSDAKMSENLSGSCGSLGKWSLGVKLRDVGLRGLA